MVEHRIENAGVPGSSPGLPIPGEATFGPSVTAVESQVPDHLKPELQAVEALIRSAFAGVTRAGGVSWSEANVIDNYGSDEERAAARSSDPDTAWEQLVDDPKWDDEWNFFPFLDAIGFRYYIAPAMIRAARLGFSDRLAYALQTSEEFQGLDLENWSLLTDPQSEAIARFLRFMLAVERRSEDAFYTEEWEDAYAQWRRWECGE